MDARVLRVILILTSFASMGAKQFQYKTPNFTVTAPSAQMAKQVGQMAEKYRVDIAKDWLGHTIPQWNRPCTIKVLPDRPGAGGATTFAINRGEVYDWRMRVEGPYERILDSVLPHEVSHTIFASHFRRPLPRWADEGAATLVECESEKRRQSRFLDQAMQSGRKYQLRKLLSIKEYPKDMRDVLTLYAQGYSLADYLVQTGGKRRYLQFLQDAHEKNWDYAIRKNYRLQNVENLEKKWNGWVLAGSPPLNLPKGQMLASNSQQGTVVRSQTPAETAPPRTFQPEKEAQPFGANLEAPDPRGGQPAPEQLAQTNGAEPGALDRNTLALPVIRKSYNETQTASPAKEVPPFDLPPKDQNVMVASYEEEQSITPNRSHSGFPQRQPGTWSKFPQPTRTAENASYTNPPSGSPF